MESPRRMCGGGDTNPNAGVAKDFWGKCFGRRVRRDLGGDKGTELSAFQPRFGICLGRGIGFDLVVVHQLPDYGAGNCGGGFGAGRGIWGKGIWGGKGYGRAAARPYRSGGWGLAGGPPALPRAARRSGRAFCLTAGGGARVTSRRAAAAD